MNAIIYHTNTLTKDELFLQRACISLFALILGAAFIYGYCINATIANVISRQNVQKEIGMLNSQVSSLESQSMTLKEGVTPTLAAKLGFVDVSETSFISDSQSLQGFSFNTVR